MRFYASQNSNSVGNPSLPNNRKRNVVCDAVASLMWLRSSAIQFGSHSLAWLQCLQLILLQKRASDVTFDLISLHLRAWFFPSMNQNTPFIPQTYQTGMQIELSSVYGPPKKIKGCLYYKGRTGPDSAS